MIFTGRSKEILSLGPVEHALNRQLFHSRSTPISAQQIPKVCATATVMAPPLTGDSTDLQVAGVGDVAETAVELRGEAIEDMTEQVSTY